VLGQRIGIEKTVVLICCSPSVKNGMREKGMREKGTREKGTREKGMGEKRKVEKGEGGGGVPIFFKKMTSFNYLKTLKLPPHT
jgi:hypothetical protein